MVTPLHREGRPSRREPEHRSGHGVKKVEAREPYEMFIHNGTKSTGLNPVELPDGEHPRSGRAGHNSIDCDGQMKGI